ncbi:unnamed protein product, partial [Porites lobata]
KAILKAADDALVKTICECVFNVLKETVPVSKPAKRKLLKHKKALTALAEEIKMNHTRRMVLVPENTLERLQQRQQILTPPVTQTLKNLDSQMGDILESKQLGDEEKAKLYNQVLQQYLTYYDQRKGQPLHEKLTAPKTTETPKPAENAESTEEASPDNSLPTPVEEEVMKSIPQIYKAGARQLLDKIKKHQDETPEGPSRWLPTPPVTLSSVKKQRRRVESPRPQAVRWLRL